MKKILKRIVIHFLLIVISKKHIQRGKEVYFDYAAIFPT